MALIGVATFERFFRTAAGVSVDKDDLKRYSDFVNRKIYDMLVRAEGIAKANLRDVMVPEDLPITKGLQENMFEFKKMNEQIELLDILKHLATLPQLDLACSVELNDRLPLVAGGLTLSLAKLFITVDPKMKEPHTVQWERSFRIFDLLL